MDGDPAAEQNARASSLSDVTTWVRRLPMGELFKACAILGSMWLSILTVGGGFITSRADEILVQALKRQGMGPADIKTMQDRLIALGLDVDRLRVTAGEVQKNLDEMNAQIKVMDANQRQTYDLLKTLIPLMKAEIEERAQ